MQTTIVSICLIIYAGFFQQFIKVNIWQFILLRIFYNLCILRIIPLWCQTRCLDKDQLYIIPFAKCCHLIQILHWIFTKDYAAVSRIIFFLSCSGFLLINGIPWIRTIRLLGIILRNIIPRIINIILRTAVFLFTSCICTTHVLSGTVYRGVLFSKQPRWICDIRLTCRKYVDTHIITVVRYLSGTRKIRKITTR